MIIIKVSTIIGYQKMNYSKKNQHPNKLSVNKFEFRDPGRSTLQDDTYIT